MKSTRSSVCLIAGGLVETNLRLQPWRYLYEVARQLSNHGHRVTVISDGGIKRSERGLIGGIPILRLPSVRNPWWHFNLELQKAAKQVEAKTILWNLGLTSFLHQEFDAIGNCPMVGIFASPVYTLKELSKLGLKRILKGYPLSAVPAAGSLIPRQLLRRRMDKAAIQYLVVQTETTYQQLMYQSLWSRSIKIISPGVDKIWCEFDTRYKSDRERWGFMKSDTILIFFGSPAPLRGLHTLLKALAIARRSDPSLKLLVLCRRREDELVAEDRELRQLLLNSDVEPHVKVISGYLDPEELVRHVATCDIVTLPFELVPSDAPLSLLEAKALGKPVVTTRVACLPELISDGISYLAPPADPVILALMLIKAAQDLRSRAMHSNETVQGWQPAENLRTWQQVGEEWSQLIQSL